MRRAGAEYAMVWSTAGARRAYTARLPPPGPPPGFHPQQLPPPPGMGGEGPGGYLPPMMPKHVKRPGEYIKKPPFNTGLNIVPQGELWVAERLGKYHTTLEPGLAILIPFVDAISYRHSSKEQAHEIANQSAITKDNVVVNIDGILFMKVVDPKKASYNVDNPIYNLITFAQTAMRSEIGKLTLDRLFEERQQLNENIKAAISKDSEGWGVECRRYEIRDILVSDIVRKSMDLQAQADRIRRKNVLESEGDRDAMTNRAEGEKQARVLVAEADRIAAVKQAEAQAEGLRVLASAQAEAISQVSDAIKNNDMSADAMRLDVAKKYLDSFGNIAKEGNTVLLPANMQDPSSMIASAMGVFSAVGKQGQLGSTAQPKEEKSASAADTSADPIAQLSDEVRQKIYEMERAKRGANPPPPLQ
eukprot:TRINITY_DN6561_c0_g2_i1.p1 TRINITY_DN6561_c0_g2~~TRINITY_DN6561_c0_g2_i1.p1  ORF type:complete len:417 (+),score=140.13 TRINITY_DN6561_c0_g2_i1:2873-4123(+)